MKKWEVSFTHVIEREITCLVEADSEEEAIDKAGDDINWIESDEDCAPEQGIETKDYEAIEYNGH